MSVTVLGKCYQPEVGERMSKNLKHKVRQVFKNSEVRSLVLHWLMPQVARFGTEAEINIDDSDVEFVVQEVWHSRCAITNRRFGGHIVLTLTRWRSDLPPTPYNLVLMMQNEAEKFAAKGFAAFSPEVVEKINSRLEWARRVVEDNERFDNCIYPTSFELRNYRCGASSNFQWKGEIISGVALIVAFGLGFYSKTLIKN